MIDLSGRHSAPADVLQRMADVLIHRGPDEDGYFTQRGLGLASRRLSIVGLFDGRQPIANEDHSVNVVFNGELFDYPEKRQMLQGRGHQFATHADTEIIPHLWEDHQEQMFDHLRGQFAIALWDERRRRLILGRDRFGICPLYWSRQTRDGIDWLLFASEIKALLASDLVPARPDPRGIHQVFNFFAVPGTPTCFAGIQVLQPGHFLRVQLGHNGTLESFNDHKYFEVDFPDAGQEDRPRDQKKLVDDFERVLIGAVDRRLRADVPVVSYLSGGIDSSLVVALACKAIGRPIPTFTIRIMEPSLDETSRAAVVSRHIGSEPTIVNCGDAEVIDNYPRLIWATETPVIDTSCTALLLLAQEVNRQNFKVALTGEGSDEWLAGYSWYKMHKLFRGLNLPFVPLGDWVRNGLARSAGATHDYMKYMYRVAKACGGYTAFHEVYGIMTLARFHFFSREMQERIGDHMPYHDLDVNFERVRRWHPLNQALYWGARIHLPGQLLSLKGDRIAMHSSVETRYPFLDEEVYSFLARLDPSWKLRGFRDKYLLRLVGERWLPKSTAWMPKGMFRAPLSSFFPNQPPPYIEQLLSSAALAKTGYFDTAAVHKWRTAFKNLRAGSYKRIALELGLVGVVATQLWHHLYIDASLCELPGWRDADGFRPPERARTHREERSPIAVHN